MHLNAFDYAFESFFIPLVIMELGSRVRKALNSIVYTSAEFRGISRENKPNYTESMKLQV